MKNHKRYVLLNLGLSGVLVTLFTVIGINQFIIVNKVFSLLFFISEYLLLVYFGMRVGIKYKRKDVVSIFLNVISPLGAYFFVWCWIEFSIRKYLMNIAIIFVLSALVEFICVEDGSLKKRWKCFKKYVCIELRPMVCFILVFVGAMAIWAQVEAQKVVQVSEQTSEQVYQEWDDYRPEDSLTANIEQASKIEEWDELDNEEKESLLQLFIRIDSRYWGMKDLVKLKIKELEENTLGQYSSTKDTIYIDKELMESCSDGYEVVYVLLHEIYHRHEHILVSLYNKILNDEDYEYYRESSIWFDANEYAREFSMYISQNEDKEAYADQKTETDADYWATKGVLEIQEKVQEYLTEKEGEKYE